MDCNREPNLSSVIDWGDSTGHSHLTCTRVLDNITVESYAYTNKNYQPNLCARVAGMRLCVWPRDVLSHDSSQCDFSQGQDEIMPALVSFRKPTVNVCPGVTLSYGECQLVPFTNGRFLFFCHRHLLF